MATAPEPQREAPPEPKLVRKLKERKEAHRRRGLIYRAAFVAAGVTLLVAGIAMLVLPGPGWGAIIVALAILALEFAWAELLLERVLVQADKAQRKAREATPMQKRLTAAATICAVAAAIGAVLLWDVPLLPV